MMGEYPIYRIRYSLPGKIDLEAEVAPSGSALCDSLTESEILLKEDILDKGESIKGYKLLRIEFLKDDRWNKSEVISNDLFDK